MKKIIQEDIKLLIENLEYLTNFINSLNENEIIEKGTFWSVLHTDILLLKNKIKK